MVVIAEGTRRLLGNLFELEDLGAKDLKGIAGPVRALAALRASSVEGRFEALHASGLTDLVGREEELELLLRRWSKAKTGEGQVVLLSGEAGIGKSRLTAALLERLATEPHTRLRYFCSPQHTDSAFYPIIGQMERAAGLAHDDTPQAKLDKLDALLAQTSTAKQDRRAVCRDAVAAERWTLSRARTHPAAAPTENAGGADRTTRGIGKPTAGADDLRGCALDRPHELGSVRSGRGSDQDPSRCCSIVTFRPEFSAPWIGRPHVTALTLNRLGERDIGAMIDRVVGNKDTTGRVIRQEIVERTDGIPLFVEEMTKAVLEAESEGAARRTAAAVPSPALAVPASLHASLMARLDRLGPAKEVAQIGAAIGREFSHALLAAVVRKPEAELAIGARPSYCGRFAVPAGRAAARDLSVQARAGAGRGLWHAAARAATRASRPHRRNPRKPIRRDCREPARTAGASLHRGWADRESCGPVGQSGTAVAGALGVGRGRRAAHPRARPDRDVARHARAASRSRSSFRSRS